MAGVREAIAAWLAATFPETAEAEGVEHEEPFLERFLALRKLEPRMRILTGLILAQVIAGGAVLAVNHLFGLGPDLYPFGEDTLSIHLGAFVASAIATTAGLTMLSLGLREASPPGRLLVLGLLTLMYAIELFLFRMHDPEGKFSIYALIVLICACVVGIPALIRKRYSPERQHIWVVRIGLGAVAVFFLGLLFLGPTLYPQYLFLLHLPLIFFFFVASTDWAELTEDVVRLVLRPARRLATGGWLVLVLVACALTGGLVLEGIGEPQGMLLLFDSPSEMPSCLAGPGNELPLCSLQMSGLTQVPALLLSLLVVSGALKLAQFRGNWPDRMPWAALLLVLGTWGVLGDLPLYAIGQNMGTLALGKAVTLALALVALVVCGRTPGLRGIAGVALFFVLCTASVVGVFTPGRLPDFASFRGILATVCLLSLLGAWLIYRRRSRLTDAADGLRLIAILNLSLFGIYALGALFYSWVRGQAESQSIVEAVIVVVALCWEMVNSGSMITKRTGRYFSQPSRLMLFLGYVSMVVAGTVFWASAEGSNAEWQEIARTYADTDQFVQVGLLVFAPAFVLTRFMLRFGRWFEQRHATAPAPAETGPDTSAAAVPASGPA